MTERPQNKNLKSYTKLPADLRATKALRFTLPTELADRLETMKKTERDAMMKAALERA